MNKKHLILIIPICLVIGFIFGLFVVSTHMGELMKLYPIMNCVYNMDDDLNVEKNKLPITKESLREAIQWRCAKEYVDFNITDYDEIFEFTI